MKREGGCLEYVSPQIGIQQFERFARPGVLGWRDNKAPGEPTFAEHGLTEVMAWYLQLGSDNARTAYVNIVLDEFNTLYGCYPLEALTSSNFIPSDFRDVIYAATHIVFMVTKYLHAPMLWTSIVDAKRAARLLMYLQAVSDLLVPTKEFEISLEVYTTLALVGDGCVKSRVQLNALLKKVSDNSKFIKKMISTEMKHKKNRHKEHIRWHTLHLVVWAMSANASNPFVAPVVVEMKEEVTEALTVAKQGVNADAPSDSPVVLAVTGKRKREDPKEEEVYDGCDSDSDATQPYLGTQAM